MDMEPENISLDDSLHMETVNKQRIVSMPWKDMLEFKQVYIQLYGAEATSETRKNALSRLRVWTVQMGDCCPAPIWATIAILQALIADDKDPFPDYNLQAIYSHGITRFLNFVTSTVKNHGNASMYELAAELQLKSFVVDVRHACSHSTNEPELSLLRSTSSYCMLWLKQHFWDLLLNGMTSITYKDLLRTNEARLAQELDTLRVALDATVEAYAKGAANTIEAKNKLTKSRFQALNSFIKNSQLLSLQECADFIVGEMRTLLKTASDIKKKDSIFLNILLKMDYMFDDKASIKSSQSKQLLTEITQKFFRLLSAQNLIKPLFLQLLKEAENADTPMRRCKGCCYWAEEILRGFHVCNRLILSDNCTKVTLEQISASQLPSQLRIQLATSGVDIKNTLVFGTAKCNPVPFTFSVEEIRQHFENLNEHTAKILENMLELDGGSLQVDQKYHLNLLTQSYTRRLEVGG